MKLFGGGKPDHPMADRKEAARILGELPAQDLKAVEELAHWHESISAAEGFKAEERAHRLALVDETAQPRLRKLAREYLAAVRGTRGSRAQENLLWARIHEYWRQAAQAHARCIDGVVQAGKGAEKSVAPMVTGTLRALAQQLKWQHLRYGPIDAAVWGLMNRIVALAEARGIHEARREYLKAALFSASSPDSLLPPELELAERLIAELAPAFTAAPAPAPELPYWIDLGKPMAPARGARPAQPAASVRYIGPGPAHGALQTFIKRVETHKLVPTELKLGADVDPEMLLGVMRHLALYWAPEAPERKHKRHVVSSNLKIAHGFDGVLQALGGGDSLDFGAQGASETWTVENVSAGGFGARAPLARTEWLKVGALIAAQPDGASNWLVGTVRRVSKVSNQEVRVGVQTLSKAPALSQFALRNNTQADGVLLPGAADPSIALRAGVYIPGENLEAKVGDRQHVYMPQGVAARGDDYEIVRFREMVREA